MERLRSSEITPISKTGSFFKPVIQKKMSVGASNDSHEIEADAVANKVMGMNVFTPNNISNTGAVIQRKCSACEQEERIQTKPLAETIQRVSNSSNEVSTAPSHVENGINSSRGGGSAMDYNTLNFMESRFGTDFSGVRIHTGSQAVQMSRELNAQAFTVGNNIYFNEGKYSPSTNSGKHLLAHELTHTIQQGKRIDRKIQKQSISGSWPPSNPTPASASASATVLAGTNLLPVILASYLEHNTNSSYFANAFYGTDPSNASTWPQTLWEGVDRVGMRLFMRSIFSVSSRLQSYPSLWAYVKRIKHCWHTSSYGYAFDTKGNDAALRSLLENHPSFCRDNFISEAIWHSSQYCWREITGSGEGLHICLGNGRDPNVHIDPNQAASGKNFYGGCTYDPSSLFSHARDVF